MLANDAMHTDAPGLSRPLQGKGRASLRRAGDRGRQSTFSLGVKDFSAHCNHPMRRKATVAVGVALVAALAAVFYSWLIYPGPKPRSNPQATDDAPTASTSSAPVRDALSVQADSHAAPAAQQAKLGNATDAQRPQVGGSPDKGALPRSHPPFPEDAETRIWQVLAANQHLGFTSIDKVACRSSICEIHFTGGPDLTDSSESMALWLPLNEALPMIKSGMISGRVERTPGVYSSIYVIRSYIGGEIIKDVPIEKL
jgi:hypothetical protein